MLSLLSEDQESINALRNNISFFEEETSLFYTRGDLPSNLYALLVLIKKSLLDPTSHGRYPICAHQFHQIVGRKVPLPSASAPVLPKKQYKRAIIAESQIR
jgi:hypothetical protein